MIGRFIIGMFAIATMQPAEASTKNLDDSVLRAIHLEDLKTSSVAHRKELADAVLQYWQSFNERIPRNSPENYAWLEMELSKSDNQRLNQAFSSPQYALFHLAGTAENCEKISADLVKAVGSSKTMELYLWLKFTQCYSQDISAYLMQAKLSDGPSETGYRMRSFGSLRHAVVGKIANSLIAQEQ